MNKMNSKGTLALLLSSLALWTCCELTVAWSQRTPKNQARPSPPIAQSPAHDADETTIRIDGIQPLFLDAITVKQTARIVGNFPSGTTIKSNSAPLSVIEDEASIAKDEIFANVTLSDITSQTVFLTLVHGQDTKSIPFKVLPACPTPKPLADDLSGSLVAPGAGRCTLPTDKTYTALNANTGELTESGTAQFCDDSSGASGSDFSLKSTYRKDTDRVRFIVCNKNPFNYTTTLIRDEEPIQNDDLSIFLGVLDPVLGASQAAKTASDTSAQKNASSTSTKTATPQNQRFEELVPKTLSFTVADPTQACLDTITSDLQILDDRYTTLVHQYLLSEAKLQDDDLNCAERLDEAQNLWKLAKTLTLDTTVAKVNQRIAALYVAIDQRIADASSGPYSNNNLTAQQLASMRAVEGALDADLCIASNAAQSISNQLAKNLLSPLETVLGSRNTFIYSTYFGPYQEPTKVSWVLQSKKIDKAQSISASTELGSGSYKQCLTQQPHGNGTDKGTVAPSGSQQPSPQGGGNKNSNSPTPPTPQKAALAVSQRSSLLKHPEGSNRPNLLNASYELLSESQNDSQESTSSQDITSDKKKTPVAPATTAQQTNQGTDETQIASGTYVFGGPRITVSAGIAGVVLRNTQFQKVQASGQASGSTIEYSTNSQARVSALIFANARLFTYKGTDKAIWGTLGVTAASNSSGVSAEYLIGASQSFLNNWLYVTGGIYIGQKQSLAGGYAVGQQLPASFTGNLPIEQSYKPGFGFAVSFRVPGTSVPKTKSTSDGGSGGTGGTATKTGSKTKS